MIMMTPEEQKMMDADTKKTLDLIEYQTNTVEGLTKELEKLQRKYDNLREDMYCLRETLRNLGMQQ